MTNTHHRTWQKHRTGYFLASVHLDPIADSHSSEHDLDLAKVTQQLIDFADNLGLPATWAVSDPAHSAATARILRSTVDHEIAILGDANWLGPTAGRTRFARELARRVAQARGAGLNVKTLVPRIASVQRHIDLVVKQQITAISGVEVAATSRWQMPLPRAVHYGVWELPITCRLPAPTPRLLPASWTTWTIWRQIRRAANAATTIHLVIDAPALAQQDPRAIQAVAWVLKRVADLNSRGMMAVETLSAAAARLADVPASSPQRSILRHAA